MTVRVVVVGGGLAGLFTATALLDHGVDDLVVLDRLPAPGGVARTVHRDGYELEPAVGTLLLPHPHLTPLLAGLGVELVPAAGAGVRYVWTGDQLVAVAASPRALLVPLLPWPAKLRAAAEPLVRARPPEGDETLDRFLRRRFGDRAGRLLGWLAASGVFAGDPARLSARAAFPALAGLEDAAGSVLRGGLQRMRRRPAGAPRPRPHVAVGGMAAVADAAAARLGERYRGGTEVTEVRGDGGRWVVDAGEPVAADHLVLACRPAAAASLLGGELGAVLARARAAPVVVLGLGTGAGIPPGFGALTGPDVAAVTRGVLFESSYAPHRAPAGGSLLKVIAGGAPRPEVVGWGDEDLVERVGGEAAQIAGCPPEWSFTEIVRLPAGIPQYPVGHGTWLDEVARLTPPGLHLTGWGYRGVGAAHVAADAAATARRIAG